MITENLTTLKINQLTKAQYEAALAAGTVNENELYATPDDNELDTTTFLRVSDVGSAVDTNPINADTLGGKSASEFLTAVDKTELNDAIGTKAPIDSPTFTGIAKFDEAGFTGLAMFAGTVALKSAVVSGNTNYTTAQLRNVILSTENPSGGNNGDIWIKYKA